MRRRSFLKAAGASLLSAPAVAQPAKTATLRFVPQANLTLLDPVFTTAIVTSNHGYYVFDTLYSTTSAGAVLPQMAEGHEVSDNGRNWRIKLRDGLKFHDGTPVRAVDCAASLERWSKREPFGLTLAQSVESWGARDDRTIEIKLTKAFPLLPDAIGKADSSCAFIMPERLARTDPNTPVKEMVGSGPYRFKADEFNTGSRAVYEKFDGYVPRAEPVDWGTGGKIAYYPRIEWNIIADPATASAALQNGEVDWWEQPLADLLPQLAANRNVTLQLDNPLGRISLMRLNHLQPPFNDVRIRRAVLAAVNQEDFMRATFGDDTSLWRTCQSMFPCGTAYETDDGGRRMKSDPNVGRAMLRDAGYAGQRVVILNPTDFPQIHPLGLVAAELLKALGMNVDLQEMDWGTVVQRRTSREPVEKGGWSIFHTFGPASGYNNPATSTVVRGLGRAGTIGWWENAAAERLVQQWLDAPDEPARKASATTLANLAMDEVGTIPVGMWFGKTAFRRSITGVLQGAAPYPWNVRPA